MAANCIMHQSALSISRARALRGNLTDAERLLWNGLRNRRLAGLKFRRQHPIGRWIVDFYCHDALLVIEADGGQHNDIADARRTADLSARGLHVLRFWNHDILQNPQGVFAVIAAQADQRRTTSRAPKPTVTTAPANR